MTDDYAAAVLEAPTGVNLHARSEFEDRLDLFVGVHALPMPAAGGFSAACPSDNHNPLRRFLVYRHLVLLFCSWWATKRCISSES